MSCFPLGDGTFLVATDARGRVNLSKLCEKNSKYLADQDKDGTIYLHPVDVKITPKEKK